MNHTTTRACRQASDPPGLIPGRERWAALADAALIAVVAFLVPLIVLRTQLRPADSTRGAAVIVAPWWSAAEAADRITRAGASLVGQGALDFVWIVKADDADYPERALASGALLVLDPSLLSFCAPLSQPSETLP